jgi:hypothetical protein
MVKWRANAGAAPRRARGAARRRAIDIVDLFFDQAPFPGPGYFSPVFFLGLSTGPRVLSPAAQAGARLLRAAARAYTALATTTGL